jgi:hypothetical protein
LRVNAIEPLNEIRAQLEGRDTELTSSLESIEREREIVRKQLGLIQELASLEEQRAGTGTTTSSTKATAATESARTASQPAAVVGSAGDASEPAGIHAEASKAEPAKSEPAHPEPTKSEPVRSDAAKPEPVKPGPEAPPAKDEPAAAPFGRGPSPWPRSAGEPDTELLRRIRAS